jgi:hypothetical protein
MQKDQKKLSEKLFHKEEHPMKLRNRIAAICTAVVLCFSLTACSDTSWVYQSGDYSVSSGIYLGYLTQAYLNGQSESDFDSSISNIWKQEIDGQSYKEYVKAQAAEDCKRYLAIAQKFDELGLSISEDDESSIATQSYYYWSLYGYQNYFEPNGTSEASFTNVLTSSLKESLIFEAYYDEGGIDEVSKEEQTEYLLNNYASVNYFEISFLDDEGAVLESDAIEALEDQANDLADRINSGELTFNEAKAEYEASQAEEDTDDEDAEDEDTEDTTETTISDDADTKSLIAKDSTSPSEDFVDTIFEDVATGKATVITIDTSYYVVVKYDLNDDLDANLESAKSDILVALKQEDFSNLVTSWMNDLEVTENTAALWKYNPKNIVEPSDD